MTDRSSNGPGLVSPQRRSRRRLVALAALLPVILVACGTTQARPRAITDDEASTLADMLVRNHRAKGAHVDVTLPYGVATFHLTGEIDWTNHVGRVTLTTTVKAAGSGTQRPARDLVWNPNVVFEEVPGLEAKLAARGRPGVSWVARSLNVTGSPLHLLLELIDSLSSTQRDNPALLRSNGARWLRTDRVGDVAVTVFEKDGNRYWVADRTKRLLRVEAALASTRTTATITFSEFGAKVIDTPADPAIVALSDVTDLYEQLVGSD